MKTFFIICGCLLLLILFGGAALGFVELCFDLLARIVRTIKQS